jgi:predicted transcriptional regulator
MWPWTPDQQRTAHNASKTRVNALMALRSIRGTPSAACRIRIASVGLCAISYTSKHTTNPVMRSTTFTVRVDTAAKKRLKRLAKSTGRSRSFLAAEAINEYLDVNEWQVAGIKRAIASLDRGEGISHERVKSHPGAAVESDSENGAPRRWALLVALRRSRRRHDQGDGHARWLPRAGANIWA